MKISPYLTNFYLHYETGTVITNSVLRHDITKNSHMTKMTSVKGKNESLVE
ncbi:hypothetical protein [Neobacillus soli]|uniref:hypothetical protein n=1 Tax=Neobacillus soli TaxID=220688 RepID=UPI000AB8A0AF|nr:hypothetical protein [Neobacillus soli]